MASTVEVVLKENLEHLGSIGDVVKVRFVPDATGDLEIVVTF